jgi:Histidine kinase
MKKHPTLRRPRPAYWWCQAGGWGGFFLINTFTSQGFLPLSWQLVSGYAALSLCGILLTHSFRAFVLRRRWLELPITRLIPRVVAVNLLLALVLVLTVTGYFALFPPRGPSFGTRGPTALLATLCIFVFNNFVILTLWSGIYFGVANFRRQRRMEIERYQAQTALAQAELRGLKSQLNPHFLFNSLNSLRALVVEEPARAQTAITQMASILRYHLQSGEHSLVPLADEIATVDQYLALELIRFEDRLTVQRTIEKETLPLLVPPLALQTLIENAIKYGVSRETGANRIEIAGKVKDGHLEVSVRNTGGLIPAPSGDSTGVGLTNLRTRLRLLFKESASLELCEPQRGWVEARMVLPATKTFETTGA